MGTVTVPFGAVVSGGAFDTVNARVGLGTATLPAASTDSTSTLNEPVNGGVHV